jgi:hypothetical protein
LHSYITHLRSGTNRHGARLTVRQVREALQAEHAEQMRQQPDDEHLASMARALHGPLLRYWLRANAALLQFDDANATPPTTGAVSGGGDDGGGKESKRQRARARNAAAAGIGASSSALQSGNVSASRRPSKRARDGGSAASTAHATIVVDDTGTTTAPEPPALSDKQRAVHRAREKAALYKAGGNSFAALGEE